MKASPEEVQAAISALSPENLAKVKSALGEDTGGAAVAWSDDAHVTLVPIFTVADGKMDDFKANLEKVYECTKAGTDENLYYGTAVEGNKVFFRQGYKSAAGVLAHMGDVHEAFGALLGLIVEGGLDLSVMGPAAELEKLKEPMAPEGAKFWELDAGAMWKGGCASGPDAHVTIVPYFTVPEGKMDEMKALFSKFYEGTKAGTDECLYYAIAIEGSTVFFRQGYKTAAGVLAHMGDVKEALDAALAIVGEGGLNLNVMGPAAELEKLKEPMAPMGTKFWELDSRAFWK